MRKEDPCKTCTRGVCIEQATLAICQKRLAWLEETQEEAARANFEAQIKKHGEGRAEG